MKSIIFLCFLILLSVPELCKCQEIYSNNPVAHLVYICDNSQKTTLISETRFKFDSNTGYTDSTYLDIDTVGMALTKCTEIKRENTLKDNLIENLRTQIKEWVAKYSNSTLTIERLAEQLSKQPAFISSHDWKITILISGLTAILTMIFMLQLNK